MLTFLLRADSLRKYLRIMSWCDVRRRRRGGRRGLRRCRCRTWHGLPPLPLDWCIRDDMKSPAGANGKAILLKVFQARNDLIYGPTSEHQDVDYKTAISRKTIQAVEEEDHAKPDNGTDEDPDNYPFAYA